MTSDELRQSMPTPRQAVICKERDFSPTRIFVDRDRLARWWFGCTCAVLIFAAVDRYRLVNAFKRREQVIVIDPAGTFYVSPLLKFQDANALHAQQSTLATIAFLERNPKDFDHGELLKQLFLKSAMEKAQAQRISEDAEFKAKQLHQKVEIGRIDILETRAESVLTQVSGQLIRTGIFQEKAFTEALPFTFKLKFQRNPNMVENGRFPTAIKDFKYDTNH
ncbi:MAG: hypothetical protein JWL59_4856 [Chthoniobacteraceae bacterium]|nr:hypothetical protein [Chthoniobacteraceae bacterium]